MNTYLHKTTTLPAVLLLAFSLIAIPASSQIQVPDYTDPGVKHWNDGPLTWQDFQTRHTPADTKKVSEIYVLSQMDYEKMKIGNTRFYYAKIQVSMDRLLSWYDPDKADEWLLRYNQVVFDMAQLYALQFQNDFNSHYSPSRRANQDYYNRLFSSRYEAIEMESSQGRDSTVIKRYEDEVRKELNQIKQTEPSIPVEGNMIWGLGLYFGVEQQIPLGASTKDFSPFTGMGMSFDFSEKDWFFDLGMGAGTCSELKTANFYHDPKYDYDWRQGFKANHFHINLNAGRQIGSTRYYRFIPFIGVGLAGFNQKTDIPFNDSNNNNNRFETSEVTGFRMQTGIKADWKMLHIIEDYAPCDIIMRMELFGGYDHFSSIGDFWSINLGISIGLDGYFIK